MPRRRRSTASLGTVILILLAITLLIVLRPSINVQLSNTPQPGVPPTGATRPPSSTQLSAAHQWGHPSKASGCVASGGLQDSACTPGDVFPNVTKDDICKSGYAQSVRNVPNSVKDAVYQEYGIASRSPGEYEVDHLVSLELGGSNDISNLWPEAASPQPGFHEKDKVENYLHDQVCSGAMTLQDAQVKIATNWLEVYQTMGK